jgi:hypothetical protein
MTRLVPVAALLLIGGCGSADGGRELEDPRASAREGLTSDAESCFADLPTACETDPAFVDGILDEVVERSMRGRFPRTRRGVDRLVRRARSAYATAQLATPAARARLETRLRTLYDDPPIRPEGEGVVADLGVVPTGLVRRPRSGWTVADEGPELDRRQWAGPEAGRVLRRLAEAHPHAAFVEAQVRLPRFAALERWRYRWIPARAQVVVFRPGAGDHTFVTPRDPKVLDALAAGRRRIHTADLHVCVGDARNFGDDPECPLGRR